MGRATRIAGAARVMRVLETALTPNHPEGGDQQVLTAEEATREVAKLHPRHREDRLDSLPELDATVSVGLVVTAEQVLHAIRLLNKDSAPGASGLTNHTLKFCACYGNAEQAKDFGTHVAAVFNKIYAGTMSARTTFLWTRTRSVLIPKPEAGAYRPIGIGDAFYRLLMRLAYSQKAEEIGSSLGENKQNHTPLQGLTTCKYPSRNACYSFLPQC